jgi:drug/metabolite transporter (DMT)-like permease
VNRRATLLFAALGVAWGIPYLLIKIAVREVSPEMLVLVRTGLAALLLLPLALWRRQAGAVLRHWPALLAFAIVEVCIPWVFLGRAELELPSSTTGLLVSAVPIVGVAIAYLTGRAEPLGRIGWLGIALGCAGVAALVGVDIGGSRLSAVAEVGIVVVCYATGPVIMTRFLAGLPSLAVIALAMTAAALLYVPIVTNMGGWPSAMPSGETIASLVTLAAVCTAVAFLLLFALVDELGPVRATTITYVNPAVAMLAGAILLSEAVTVWKLLGLVLVVLGSYFVTKRRAVTAEPEPESEVSVARL